MPGLLMASHERCDDLVALVAVKMRVEWNMHVDYFNISTFKIIF
jgi:hypothetical protein